ncbi:hypothetical protein [Senegalimassilia anaerobia]|uniref:hypothetical protein n=1 Tax=Senegalimassilia anaerobia TaxID=1473216 RepID=UPI003A8E91F8
MQILVLKSAIHHIFKDEIARKAHTHTRKETGERAAFRDWGFGAVAIGAALQDGPLACVGQANGPLSVSGRFAGCVAMVARRFRSIRGKIAVSEDSYFQKNAVLGDSYLRKSAEFS